jgi:branched-chain amino acid transport system ATP-binding protein
MALSLADHGYVLETGRVVLDQPAASLLQDERVQHFYLGLHKDKTPVTPGLARAQRAERRWTR